MTDQTQTKRAWLIPAEGKKIRRPDVGEYLPEDGAEVIMSNYWRRLIRWGDVNKSTKPKAAKNGGK